MGYDSWEGPRDPVSEGEMTRKKFLGNYTICQTLRDTYAIVDDKEIRLRLRIIMAMAKAMDDKLHEYKKLFERNPNRWKK